jgi:phospholipase C
VHGPNGFLREIAGTPATNGLDVVARIVGPTDHPRLSLRLTNTQHRSAVAVITGVGNEQQRLTIAPGTHTLGTDPIVTAHGWYDISVRIHGHHQYLRRFAGHLENGRNSITG